ncbi:transposon Ty3-G Gag-Pol polyprotein [Trichonephila inaurata madagascariensis]|uniref:Transposon Ty3-G Gag-Pol polyprotein n=1 Tax=Trichonephila inaurata madagascariensis TaxID=2747483 RepID=A0A8X7BRT2_9ARAC|nr:transposon Ty3-G Gag-Pol polyprotein [Trichonephila inaurata madagascariensis]
MKLLEGDPAHFGILKVNSLSPSNRNAVLRISINGVSGTAFADSGASYSIAEETIYTILLQQGAAFEKTAISISFADRIVTQKEVLRTFQTVLLEGRKFKNPFIILPDDKNNSTLLGVDFLEKAGIVLNFRKSCWAFCDDSRKSYNFVTPYQSTSVNVRPVAINNCQLREDGQELLGSQRAELNNLLKINHSIFDKKTAKFMPKRDGPYIIGTQRSPATYEVANPNNTHEVLGPYHSSALRPCIDKEATPMLPLKKRGRPGKTTLLDLYRGRYLGTRGGV